MRDSALKFFWLGLAVLLLDLASKWAANTWLTLHELLPVLPHFNLTLNYNTGAAFSFLADAGGWQRWGFTVLAVVMVAGLLWWLRRLPPRLTCESAGLWLVIGGALGNLVERIYDGRVTDFFDFYWGDWHYATFNVADVGISVGAFCLIVHEFWGRKRQEAGQ
ncbi:MAG: lipoprotein signal peptidase [Gammaproteobacteria bacterium]|nr:MAG: lipoprotein signal peptidase [Gammaproteobacteria bacterium]